MEKRVIYRCYLLNCRDGILTDEDALSRFLEVMPTEIGMTKVSAPLVVPVASDKTPYVGYSGCIVISTSHVAFHSYPEFARMEILIYSCQTFDSARATEFARQYFGATGADTIFTEEQVMWPVPLTNGEEALT
jgi:S-adenosylmethionine/arginine decarboxylase-like enzyme